MGSGDAPVPATPRLLAWMEGASQRLTFAVITTDDEGRVATGEIDRVVVTRTEFG